MRSIKKRADPGSKPLACAVVLLLLLSSILLTSPSVTAQAQEAECGDRQAHERIHIGEDHGPQGFTWTDPTTGEDDHRPGSGVISGDGSAADPFMIAGWCIEPDLGTLGPGIHIEGTTAHVLVRDNAVLFQGPSMGEMAIRIETAMNLVLRENVVSGGEHGIGVWSSQGVLVDANTLVDNVAYGVWVAQLENAVIRDNHVSGNENGIGIGLAHNSVVSGNTVTGNANTGILNAFSDHAVLRENLITGNREGIYIREAFDVLVEDNHVLEHTGGAVAFDMATDGTLTGNTIIGTGQEGVIYWNAPRGTATGNTIKETGVADDRAGLRFSGAAESVAADNVLLDNAQGLILEGSPDSIVNNNIITGNQGTGVWTWQTTGATIQDNTITGNAPGIRVDLDATGTVFTGNNIQVNTPGLDATNAESTVDAQGNWWGCPGGPGNTDCDAVIGSADTSGALSAPNPSAPTPPLLHIPAPAEGTVGKTLVVNVSASHPDAETVELSPKELPAGAQFIVTKQTDGLTNGTLTWTPMVHQEGSRTIVFQAKAADMQATASLTVHIDPPAIPPGDLQLTRLPPNPEIVSPGQTLQLHAKLENLGTDSVLVPLGVTSTQSDWSVSTEGGVSLAPGESVPITVDLTVGPTGASSRIVLVAHAEGADAARTQLTWILDVPVYVDIAMNATTTGQTITGTATARYADGSPASGLPITGTRTNGPDIQGHLRSTISGTTNETGQLPIGFEVDDLAAQVPGTHILSLEGERDERPFRGHTSYQVELF